jgi:hypothetical protein
MLVINKSNLPLIDYRELKPFQGSLKDLTDKNYKKLLKSFNDEGFFIPAFVWFDGETPYILDAHQRQRVLIKENIEFENTGHKIPYVEIEAKDKEEAAQKLLKITSQYGTITQEGLDAFIATYQLPEAEIYEATHYDALMFGQDPEEEPEVEEDETYTKKIEAPVYEPSEKKPEIKELYAENKYLEIIKEINQSTVSEVQKDFLRASATRLIEFNYEKIADYYAHSDDKVKHLMNRLALVVIDFNSAIENGYLQLTDKIEQQFSDEYNK